jgi:hypothetical protein
VPLKLIPHDSTPLTDRLPTLASQVSLRSINKCIASILLTQSLPLDRPPTLLVQVRHHNKIPMDMLRNVGNLSIPNINPKRWAPPYTTRPSIQMPHLVTLTRLSTQLRTIKARPSSPNLTTPPPSIQKTKPSTAYNSNTLAAVRLHTPHLRPGPATHHSKATNNHPARHMGRNNRPRQATRRLAFHRRRASVRHHSSSTKHINRRRSRSSRRDLPVVIRGDSIGEIKMNDGGS